MAAREHAECGAGVADVGEIEKAVDDWDRAVERHGPIDDHLDRAGHPLIASFYNTDETKEEYNRTEPAQDRELFMHQAVEILEHNGGYSAEEAERVLDEVGLLPDMMRGSGGESRRG